jgi:uncharacterized repeat protein (TIGR03803 family)
MNYKKLPGAASAALLIVILTLVLAPGSWAQSKYRTLYKFKGGTDGGNPQASLIFDQAGNLYGTTNTGGVTNQGTAFRLTRNQDGSWRESVLHSFGANNDGKNPVAGMIFDTTGNLYGTTPYGGVNANGTVFQLTPNQGGSWTETVLYSFSGADGGIPMAGLITDQAGNLYGTTAIGGAYKHGTVFQLTPNADGSWTESTLYDFKSRKNGNDGAQPRDALTFDHAGNLFGTTRAGGAYSYGVVFQLTPNADGSWTESVLHSFNRDRHGKYPQASLIFDQAGNLYGTTPTGGAYREGVVFKLSPNSDGTRTDTVIHSFRMGPHGAQPQAGLIFDQAGNLYGTTEWGGNFSRCTYGCGVVFKLTPNSDGSWKETVVRAFAGLLGGNPQAALLLDAAGNLYGTTSYDTYGSVFEITP